jgi:hypothetical protein
MVENGGRLNLPPNLGVDMTTQTLGTTTTTILTAIRIGNGDWCDPNILASPSIITPADFATIKLGIKDDKINAAGSHPVWRDALTRDGQLFIPNRGVLKIRPGDVVAIDNNGWPILVSGDSIAYASSRWVLT